MSSKKQLVEQLSDPWWRLNNLYKIIAKDKSVITFRPNPVQARFLRDMHCRNVIPKARQRGLSTAIQILMLDTALFSSNFKGKVIAQDKDAASEIFRDKLKFAYENLPKALLEAMPLKRDSAAELLFFNNSSVSVTTSARSGTVQMMHVSEFGKIAAKYPEKAREVITGSIPAVPPDGFVFVESTAEGQEGEFYDMVQKAKALLDSKAKLTPLDFKLLFYSWWDADEYQLSDEDAAHVVITRSDHDYFDRIEHEIGQKLSLNRRAWYVKTREGLNSQEMMWREYPSIVEESFQVSLEGCYYTEQLAKARKEGRIGKVPHDPSLPVMTFWDIGHNDETAIWCVQRDRKTYQAINYFEASGESFGYFVGKLKDTGYTWDRHFLPHDADHKRQLGDINKSALQMIQELAPGWNFEIVPRIPDVTLGIRQTRDVFPLVWIDETKCADGLKHLQMYKKEWDPVRSCWKDYPRHDRHSNGADAFRGLGQSHATGMINATFGDVVDHGRRRNWRA